MTPQQQFSAKVAELIRQSRALTPAARKAVVELLEEAKTKILGQLATMDPQRFQAAQLQALKVSIDQALDKFRSQAITAVNGLQANASQLGSATVTQPLAATFGGGLPLGRVSIDTLSIAQGYTADLISGLSKQASAQVNAAIQRAFLGGQNLTEIIGQISKALGKGSGIAERATTIAVNEILRVHSIAAQASLEDAAERHPGLQKQWKHINAAARPRATHLVADGQVVPVGEAFSVGGEDLMFPRDPNGSAENTINCHCLMTPYFDRDSLQASDEDKSLLDRLGIAVQTIAA